MDRRAIAKSLLALLVLALVLGAFAAAFLVVPARVVGSRPSAAERDRITLVNQVRSAAVQALGGLLVVVGSVLTVRTLWLTREGQITDRFTAAVGHLGSSERNMRIGAIYALGRVARDSRVDQRAVIALLGDHLREHAPARPTDDQGRPIALPERVAPHPEVQAVAAVLRRRRVRGEFDDDAIDLSDIDLRFAPLSGGRFRRAAFRMANLEGALLEGADLREANFTAAVLSSASLQGAKLDGADLTGADLRAAHADRASFVGAMLEDASLRDTELRGANLRGAHAAQLDRAITDAATRTSIPAGDERPERELEVDDVGVAGRDL